MKLFGLELEKLIRLKLDRGEQVEGNDLLLAPDRMLPPPRIEGKVTAVDPDPRDPFDFFLDHYNEQLVAGYDQNLPDHGLIVHMPDYRKITGRGERQEPSSEAQPRTEQEPKSR